MAKAGMFWVSLVLCVTEIWTFGVHQLSDGLNIIPWSIYKCKDYDPLITIDMSLRLVNDETNVLDIDMTLEDDFSEDWMLNVKMDKWNNGGWDENFYDSENFFCKAAQEFFPKIWKKIRKHMSPSIEEGCAISAGHYVGHGFRIFKEDYHLPAAVLGRYRFTAKLIDPSETEVWCQIFDMEATKNH